MSRTKLEPVRAPRVVRGSADDGPALLAVVCVILVAYGFVAAGWWWFGTG